MKIFKNFPLNVFFRLQENARVDLESSNQNYHPTELLISRLSALTGIQPIDPAISPETVFSFDQQHHNGGYSFKSPADAAVGGSGAGNGNGGSGIGEPKPLLGKEEIKPDNPTSKKLRTVADSEPAPPSGTATNIDIVAEMQNPTGLEEKSGEPQGTPPPESPSQQSKSPKPIAWNKGVGYGSGAGVKNKKVWDAKRAEALQDARDAELYDVLSSLAQAAEKAFKDTTTVEEAMKVDGVDKPEESSGDEEKRIVVTALKSGCLVPFLLKELSSAGFQGMASRASYYRALLQCVHVLCLHPETASMLCWHAEDDLKSLATAMASLKAQGATFLRVLGDQAAGSLDHQIEDDSQLATLLLTVAKEVETLTSSSPPSLDPSPPAEDGSNPLPLTNDTQMPTAPTSEDVSEAHYVSIMSPFKVSLVPGIATNHVYQSNASKEPTAASRQRARRVASELASLESDLPINASSSVFVCADEQQTVLWKAMITGPKGTPYESGCFLFDIYFPGEYPHKAPSVQLRTTGGGTVRFNPNLYNCGKVCLSLLGTWQGEKGESWSAEYSSILQVLISIQSLILVDQPFYNEPGYESRPDNQASDAYSADIMQHTVKWAMLDQLQSPPEYFAEAIKSHFRERGEVVLATVRRWEKWCTDIGALGPAAAIEKMLPELENEISKLKNV
jgi:baculoviral IAP repeat-containing protein 6